MTEDVDPENPRPEGHYHVEAESTWYYVDDGLADTIATGQATDAEPICERDLTAGHLIPEPQPAEDDAGKIRTDPHPSGRGT